MLRPFFTGKLSDAKRGKRRIPWLEKTIFFIFFSSTLSLWQDKLELGIITTSTASTTRQVTTTATVVADLATTTYQKTTTTTQKRRKSLSSTSWLPSVSFNLTSSTTSTTESTPYPPLTLSLGAWQITEEDLPIYVGSAAGVLLLIILLLGVTTWRCCVVPSHSSLHSSSPVKSKDDSHSKFFPPFSTKMSACD